MAAAEEAVSLATERLSERESVLRERERQLLERETALEAARVREEKCSKTRHSVGFS